MMYDKCMEAILQNPEDDAPRHELGRIVKGSDPQWSEFIERQLWMSKRMRDTRYHPGVATAGSMSREEEELLLRGDNERRWSRDLDFYMGEFVKHRSVTFYRGLPWMCTMSPYVFLKSGAYVLKCIAPLRGIAFFVDPPGDSFPMKEIAASPLLARFDHIKFLKYTLEPGDLELFAASPHLERLMTLDVRGNTPSFGAYEAFAANPLTRRCLSIDSYNGDFTDEAPSDHGPIGEFRAHDDWGNYEFEMSVEGRELENKFGYLPWLHLENRAVDVEDCHYFVDHRVTPMFEPGSPANAPTPYGTGELSGAKTLQPREKALVFLQR